MRKLLAAALLGLPLVASAITLTWDLNDPMEFVDTYNIYEYRGTDYTFIGTNNLTGTNINIGTNWVKIGSVTNTNVFSTPTLSGLHIFSVTASNGISESSFSLPFYYRGANAPRLVKISR